MTGGHRDAADRRAVRRRPGAVRSSAARWRVVAGGVVLGLVGVASCGDDGGFGTTDDLGSPGGDLGVEAAEVLLEPVSFEMPDPFVGENLDVVPDLSGAVEDWAANLGTDAATAPPLAASEDGGATVAADEAGVYGGSLDSQVCDVEQLVAFLTDPANAALGEAWAGVQGIGVEDIPDFVAGLTPVRLRLDTRVTNHGFSDGEATPVQSVLQAGTAVLVDDRGVPRAKCECGNPLAEPEPMGDGPGDDLADVLDQASNPDDAWAELDPAKVVTVEPGRQLDQLELVDLDTGEPFQRPVGTTGAEDQAELAEPVELWWRLSLDDFTDCGEGNPAACLMPQWEGSFGSDTSGRITGEGTLYVLEQTFCPNGGMLNAEYEGSQTVQVSGTVNDPEAEQFSLELTFGAPQLAPVPPEDELGCPVSAGQEYVDLTMPFLAAGPIAIETDDRIDYPVEINGAGYTFTIFSFDILGED